MEERSGEERFCVMHATVTAFRRSGDQIAAHGGPASNEKRRPKAPLTLYFRKIRPVCGGGLQFQQGPLPEAREMPVPEWASPFR
jgi:hypothetical protein